jgi:hypothetical protein
MRLVFPNWEAANTAKRQIVIEDRKSLRIYLEGSMLDPTNLRKPTVGTGRFVLADTSIGEQVCWQDPNEVRPDRAIEPMENEWIQKFQAIVDSAEEAEWTSKKGIAGAMIARREREEETLAIAEGQARPRHVYVEDDQDRIFILLDEDTNEPVTMRSIPRNKRQPDNPLGHEWRVIGGWASTKAGLRDNVHVQSVTNHRNHTGIEAGKLGLKWILFDDYLTWLEETEGQHVE